MNISILEVRGVKSETLKAIAKVKFEELGMIFNEVKFFSKEGRQWVQMPSKQYMDNGQTKYFPLVQFSDKKVESKIKEEITRLIAKEIEVSPQFKEHAKMQAENSFDGLI